MDGWSDGELAGASAGVVYVVTSLCKRLGLRSPQAIALCVVVVSAIASACVSLLEKPDLVDATVWLRTLGRTILTAVLASAAHLGVAKNLAGKKVANQE